MRAPAKSFSKNANSKHTTRNNKAEIFSRMAKTPAVKAKTETQEAAPAETDEKIQTEGEKA